MSYHALYAAFLCREGTPAARLVMQSLAGCHNDETGQCDPSQRWLAWDTGLDEKTVRRALAELEERGEVGREKRTHPQTGNRLSDAYTLRFMDADVMARRLKERKENRPAPTGHISRTPQTGGSPGDQAGTPPGANGGLGGGTAPGKSVRESGSRNQEGCAHTRDAALLADRIWREVLDDRHRKRSISKPKIADQLVRRLKDGQTPDQLMEAARRYWSDPDLVARDGSGVQQAAFRFFADKGAWPTYLPPAQPAEDLDALLFDAAPEQTQEASPGAPPLWQQRVWMDEYHQSKASWRVERGPRPGHQGCRVEPWLQREHGIEPWGEPQ